MKNKELDHVDREILRMLQEDARMSLKDIAEAVFLSSPAVSVRIDNMIEAGYIEGFHATVNPVKMGYHIKAFINLEVSPIDKEQFYPYIKACFWKCGFLVHMSWINSLVNCSNMDEPKH